MTRSQLILRLAELNPHLYHRDVERIVATVFDEISAALARGDRVELRGFGACSVKRRAARGMVAVPVAVAVVWFAVANRDQVRISFDPLPLELEPPIFAVAFAALFIGFVGGAAYAWLGGHKWRRRARQHKREAAALARQIARLGERPESGAKGTREARPAANAAIGNAAVGNGT